MAIIVNLKIQNGHKKFEKRLKLDETSTDQELEVNVFLTVYK